MKNHIDFVLDERGSVQALEITAENGKTVTVGRQMVREDGKTVFRITEGEMESAIDTATA